MNKLIKISPKIRKKHIMLIIELFFSFIALFLVLAFVFRIINNSKEPLGFNYKNVSMLNLSTPNIDNDSLEKKIMDVIEYIKSDVNIENIDKLN